MVGETLHKPGTGKSYKQQSTKLELLEVCLTGASEAKQGGIPGETAWSRDPTGTKRMGEPECGTVPRHWSKEASYKQLSPGNGFLLGVGINCKPLRSHQPLSQQGPSKRQNHGETFLPPPRGVVWVRVTTVHKFRNSCVPERKMLVIGWVNTDFGWKAGRQEWLTTFL